MIRALQKKPEDRYASMGDFADALELIALGKNAPEQKILKIAALKKRRNPYIPVVLLTLILAAIIGASIWGYSRFYAQTPQQTTAPSIAPIIDSGSAEADSTKTPVPTAQEPSEQLPTSTPVEEPTAVPAAAQSSGVTLLGTSLPNSLPSSAQEIARWGIGGISVVDWSEKAIAIGTTSGIFLYDAQSREMTLFIDTKFNVTAMSFNRDGGGITAGSTDGDVVTWNTRTGAIIHDFGNTSGIVTAITYSMIGNNFAVGYSNGTINYFSTSDNSLVTKLEEYPTVEDLAISDDGRFIYASNGKNTVSVWDIQKKTKESELVHTAAVSNLSLSSNRQFMLSGGSTNAVYLWDLSGPRLVSGFTALGGTATDFDFSYDDKYAVIGLSTGEVKIFEIPTPENYSRTQVPIHTKKGYAEQIRSVALSPNQLIAATGNWEEGLKFWDILSGENTPTIADESMRAIEEIYFSNDGRWLATSHDGNIVRVWRVSSAGKAYQFEGYLPKGVPFSPDNKYLAFIKPSGRNRPDSIQVVELASGNILADLPGYPKDAFVQFRTDSKLLIAGTPYEAAIWDVATWEKLASTGGPTAGCGQYFTPQNNLLSVISDAGILFSYDRKIQDMCGLAKTIAGATFMYYFPQQNKLLFVLGDGTIWIGNNSDPSRSRILPSAPYPLPGSVFIAGHEGGLYAQAVNDNLLIKTQGSGSSVNIRHNDDYLYRVAFSPGTKLFALGTKFGSIHIWALP
jgi:WD40 repeat protein